MRRQTACPILLTAVLLASVLLATACSTDRMVARMLEDARLDTAVKTAILNAPGVDATRVDVVSHHGAVTLSGAARSREEADRLVEITRRVAGVTRVTSHIKVKPITATTPGDTGTTTARRRQSTNVGHNDTTTQRRRHSHG